MTVSLSFYMLVRAILHPGTANIFRQLLSENTEEINIKSKRNNKNYGYPYIPVPILFPPYFLLYSTSLPVRREVLYVLTICFF